MILAWLFTPAFYRLPGIGRALAVSVLTHCMPALLPRTL